MIVEGLLFDWFETGLEGVVWVVQAEGIPGCGGLHAIREGDHLKIIAPNDDVVFNDVIQPSRLAGEDSKRIGRDQPISCGRWIHWYQQGFHPDAWGRFFFSEDHRAILTRSDI